MRKGTKKVFGAAAVTAALLVSGHARAGFIANLPLFINEDIVIAIPPGFGLISITKIINLIGDPPVVDDSVFVNTLGGGPPTVVTSAGQAAITFSAPSPTSNGSQHVGFSLNGGSPSGPGQVIENPGIFDMSATLQSLSTPATMTIDLPALNGITTTNNNGKTTQFDIVFAQATAGGLTVGEWFEAPVTPMPQFQFANDSTAPLTISNAEFFISDTPIPLDQLNAMDLPPTDPRFLPLPVPDGTLLGPGERTAELRLVPEPASITVLAVGALALVGAGWRRRRSSVS